MAPHLSQDATSATNPTDRFVRWRGDITVKTFSSATPSQRTIPLHSVALSASSSAGHGAYLGGDRRGWYFVPPEHSVMILGPPRAGKTASLVIPNVLAANGPVVSTSTKADVLDATVAARARIGNAMLFDPSGSVGGGEDLHRLRWSPLQSSATWTGALSAARSLVEVGTASASRGASSEGTHWTERAQSLLAPLLHAAALDATDMRTLLTWVDRRQALPAQQILAGEAGQATALARNLLDGIATTDQRELSGIWSTASGALSGFRSDEALAATSDPDFDAASFVRSSDTIYIAAPAHLQVQMAPLVVGLIEDIRRATYARAADRTSRAGNPPPGLLAQDEVANKAPHPDLPSMISEGGGQGLITLACLQDLSQARHRWPGHADGFPSLFGTTVVLPGIGDVRTLGALSTLAGDEEIPTRTMSAGRALGDRPFTDLLTGGRPHFGESVSTQWRPRLPVDAIARGMTGHGLTFDQRNEPSWVPLTPSHTDEPWRSLRALDRSAELERHGPLPSLRNKGPARDQPGSRRLER
jgi:type IV secretory pathway TraG/TraD family ATPase VirD4